MANTALAVRKPFTSSKDTLRRALERALDDEWHALALYEAVLLRFGGRPPFSNIVHAERRHASALLTQFSRLSLKPPPNRWHGHEFNLPETFSEACDMAEIAEIHNAALYDDLIESVNDQEIQTVFENLRAASLERHLRAFRRHSNGWKIVTHDELTARQKTQYERAVQARDDMYGQLMSRLETELKSAKPPAAIDVCKVAAPEIAQKVAARKGVRIGRTSWKLRNPTNTGPPWVALAVHEKPEAPVLAASHDDRLGVTLPIRVSNACLACHGDPKKIAAEVRSKLREQYPDDQATGFRSGDLRGWFWVELAGE
jgi:rubrerythrin